jgi:hypothetical protein
MCGDDGGSRRLGSEGLNCAGLGACGRPRWDNFVMNNMIWQRTCNIRNKTSRHGTALRQKSTNTTGRSSARHYTQGYF